MRISNKISSRNTLASAYRHLFEQGLFGDEGGEEEKKEEEPEEKPAADEEKEEEKDEDAGDEKEEKEKPKSVTVSPAEEARLADVVDQEIEDVLVDFESDARKAAAIENEKSKIRGESRKYSLKRHLFEVAADEDIDLRKFASDVARLVKNYDTLLDMKSIILNKAISYIKYKYDDETEKALRDLLKQNYDLEPLESQEEMPDIPVAVGARTPA